MQLGVEINTPKIWWQNRFQDSCSKICHCFSLSLSLFLFLSQSLFLINSLCLSLFLSHFVYLYFSCTFLLSIYLSQCVHCALTFITCFFLNFIECRFPFLSVSLPLSIMFWYLLLALCLNVVTITLYWWRPRKLKCFRLFFPAEYLYFIQIVTYWKKMQRWK